MAQRPPRPLLIVADGVLLSMANNLAFRKQFPFLTTLYDSHKRYGRSCGGCGKKVKGPDVYAQAKQSLASMSPDKKEQFKRMLNAEKIIVRWIDATGNRREAQF